MKYEECDMKSKSSNSPEDVHMCDLLVNFLDIHWNDVDISIETVETLEEIENNSDGSGSCDSSEVVLIRVRNKNTFLAHTLPKVKLPVSASKGCTNLWYKPFCVQKKLVTSAIFKKYLQCVLAAKILTVVLLFVLLQ
jgi:hypothetical protein